MRAALGLLVLFLSGCTTGFDRGALQERLQKEGIVEVQDKEIQEVRALKPQLTFPCRIALYLKPPSGNEWRWTSQDKEILNSSAQGLQKEGIASTVILMSGMFAKDGDLKQLRMEAARYGADALLVVQGVHQTDSYLNPAAVLNLTVVGGFIVPASHRDTLFRIEGVLVDVGNGCLYASVESEGEGRIVRPTFIVEDKEAIDRAKKKALEAVGPELVRHLRSLHTGLSDASQVGNSSRPATTVLLPPRTDSPVGP